MSKPTTILKPLTLAFAVFLVVPVSLLLVYIVATALEHRPYSLIMLFTLAGTGFIVGLAGFLLVVLRLRKAFRSMITGMRSIMLAGDRSQLQSQIQVETQDEVGRLGNSFNEMQAYISKHYEEVESQLELASRIQQYLMPTASQETDAFEVAAACQQTQDVGGDLYDVVDMGEGRLALLIGDVVGKGLPAAVLMMAVVALFRREIRKGGSPAEMIGRMNVTLVQALQGETFVTMAIAILDANSDIVQYASAGHMSPYLVREDGTLVEVEGSSLPIGVEEEVQYRNIDIPFTSGMRLVLYTDGLVDSFRSGANDYGFDMLEARLRQISGRTPLKEELEHLLQGLKERGERSYQDDLTLILVQRKK
jgi:serine phosphatase RsbU (regulator of sigma subunit)